MVSVQPVATPEQIAEVFIQGLDARLLSPSAKPDQPDDSPVFVDPRASYSQQLESKAFQEIQQIGLSLVALAVYAGEVASTSSDKEYASAVTAANDKKAAAITQGLFDLIGGIVEAGGAAYAGYHTTKSFGEFSSLSDLKSTASEFEAVGKTFKTAEADVVKAEKARRELPGSASKSDRDAADAAVTAAIAKRQEAAEKLEKVSEKLLQRLEDSSPAVKKSLQPFDEAEQAQAAQTAAEAKELAALQKMKDNANAAFIRWAMPYRATGARIDAF